MALIRRGWVQTMLQAFPRPASTSASSTNCGSWVVFPQPVSPDTTTTCDPARAARKASFLEKAGSLFLKANIRCTWGFSIAALCASLRANPSRDSSGKVVAGRGGGSRRSTGCSATAEGGAGSPANRFSLKSTPPSPSGRRDGVVAAFFGSLPWGSPCSPLPPPLAGEGVREERLAVPRALATTLCMRSSISTCRSSRLLARSGRWLGSSRVLATITVVLPLP
mmetsp:Transcript_22376/g.62038  ORF Transcript_22376/g.62038 Transcript_22376/m.62038 type:complete len:223 (-) Transcript_22376:239-907(-)